MIIGEGRLEVRWFRKQDFPQLKELHRLCYPEEAWRVRDFIRFATTQAHVNVLKVLGVENSDLIVGSLLYTLDEQVCRLRRCAILPRLQKRGLGTFTVQTALIGKRSPIRRTHFLAYVPERNYPAQEFLAKLRFTFDPARPRQRRNNEELYEFHFEKRARTA